MVKSLHLLRIGLLACAGGCFGIPGVARAQNFEITPISIELLPGQMTTTLLVTNNGAEQAIMQVRPFQWGQHNGRETLVATEDLAVGPPITEIDAGHSQIFRVVLRRAATTTEGTYRLLLDQLPSAAAPGTVRVALRFSIPIFADASARSYSKVDWSVVVGQGGATLVGVNHGGQHIRILNPVLMEDGRRFQTEPGVGPYILAGQQHSWVITAGSRLAAGSTLRLTATSDGGPVDAMVHVSEQ